MIRKLALRVVHILSKQINLKIIWVLLCSKFRFPASRQISTDSSSMLPAHSTFQFGFQLFHETKTLNENKTKMHLYMETCDPYELNIPVFMKAKLQLILIAVLSLWPFQKSGPMVVRNPQPSGSSMRSLMHLHPEWPLLLFFYYYYYSCNSRSQIAFCCFLLLTAFTLSRSRVCFVLFFGLIYSHSFKAVSMWLQHKSETMIYAYWQMGFFVPIICSFLSRSGKHWSAGIQESKTSCYLSY